MKLLLPLVIFFSTFCLADEQAYIAVGSAKTKKTVVALNPVVGGEATLRKALDTALSITKNDLLFMDLFQIQDPAAFLDKSNGVLPGTFKISDWSGIGTDFVLKGFLNSNGKGGLQLEAYLYNVSTGAPALTKRYISSLGDTRALGHSIANDIVNTITGLPGIFQTKIAMVCDKARKKELFVMDFDGSNVKQITRHRSSITTPAWSPDGTKIAYSLVAKNKRNVKNWNLYEFNFATSSIKLLSDRKGINSGAHYHPDGEQIALTMSFLGNPEIFIFDPKSKNVTRLTDAPSVDVDPNWSPDGRSLSFISGRSGAPMVYRMDADGGNVKRLTFAGKYNATPSWSPQNNKIAFAGWIDGIFDIFIMNVDGTNIERLTKSQGNNEDPSFSPDGNFVVFSSNRAGQKNIYVMNVDGTFVKRLTYGMGDCVSPRWSNPPR
jgi:TolB protein